MGTKVKPVQPTEIKDKKIVYQVIQEIRRKPTAAALKQHKAGACGAITHNSSRKGAEDAKGAKGRRKPQKAHV